MSRDCKIIEDLIPSYIDELTNEVTNEFIEDHIKNCEDCKNKIEKLKNTNEKIDDSNIKVDFLKKQKMIYRVLYCIIAFVCLILVLNSSYLNIVLRMKKLLDAQKSINTTNYYVEIKTYTPEKDIEEYYYCKDGKLYKETTEIDNITHETITTYSKESNYKFEKFEIKNIQEFFEKIFGCELASTRNPYEEKYIVRENNQVRYYNPEDGLVNSIYYIKENKIKTFKYSFGFMIDYEMEKIEKEISNNE